MINVNTVYKTVLSIMNKEQRGYLTPDEFNKIAKQVQIGIIDQTFYDYNRMLNLKNVKNVNAGTSDVTVNIREKLYSLFKTSNIVFTSNTATLPTDIYKPIQISSTDNTKLYEEIMRHEMSYMLSSPLTAPSSLFPTYYKNTGGDTVSCLPALPDSTQLTIDYIKHPSDPRFGYSTNQTYGTHVYDSNEFVNGGVAVRPGLFNSVTVNTTTLSDGTYTGIGTTGGTGSGLTVSLTVASNQITACGVTNPGTGYSIGDTISILGGGTIILSTTNLYNSSTYGSTNFELHPSEETKLILNILAFAGIIIKDPSIVQAASTVVASDNALKQ